jgi:hypothetical protein
MTVQESFEVASLDKRSDVSPLPSVRPDLTAQQALMQLVPFKRNLSLAPPCNGVNPSLCGAFFERQTLLLTPNHDGAAVDGGASPRSARSANQVVPQTHGVQRKQQRGASCGATCRKAMTNWLFIFDLNANELLSGSIRHCRRFRRLQSRLRAHPSRRSTLPDFQNILPASFECR